MKVDASKVQLVLFWINNVTLQMPPFMGQGVAVIARQGSEHELSIQARVRAQSESL